MRSGGAEPGGPLATESELRRLAGTLAAFPTTEAEDRLQLQVRALQKRSIV